MIKSGRLRHKIDIKKLSVEQDESGRSVKNYIQQFAMRCNVQVLSGTELIKAGVGSSTEYVSILARFDNRIKHDQFFEWKGNIFSVESIKPGDTNLQMFITGSRDIK